MNAHSICRTLPIQFAFTVALFTALFTSGCDQSDENRGPAVPLTEVEEVAVGKDHSCALRRDGTVVCWGYNSKGQLGSDPENDDFEALDPFGFTTDHVSGYSPIASAVDGLSGVRHIAAGADHSCAIIEDRSVWCWGDAAAGQLGNGDFSIDDCEGRPCSRKPVRAVGIDDAVELSLGDQYSCARLEDGRLSCWGSNAVGQRPEQLDVCDSVPCATIPLTVPFLDGVRRVRAGDRHACALFEMGVVYCWGSNSVGQVGVSNPPTQSINGFDVLQPIDRPSRANLRVLIDRFATDRSLRQKSCVVAESGSYYCWGRNDYGELGIGPVETEPCWTSAGRGVSCVNRPHRVALDPEVEVEEFVLADDTGCAVSRDHRLYCWGRADLAQLGRDAEVQDACLNDRPCSRSPIAIPTSKGILDVAIGPRYVCALQTDDRIACWGWGYPAPDDQTYKQIDCSSSLDPCFVKPRSSWTGQPRALFFDHFDTFCVLTQAREIHCVDGFIRDPPAIRAKPIKVYP